MGGVVDRAIVSLGSSNSNSSPGGEGGYIY